MGKLHVSLIWISALISSYISDTNGNMVQENAPGVGGHGGTCRCPDGKYFDVGDNNDGCKTLACVNGEKVDCKRMRGAWSNRKVICAGIP